MSYVEEKRNGSVECMRFGFILLNTLALVFGLGLLFLGVWFYAIPANENLATITLDSSEGSTLATGILLVISVGTGVCLLAIISCCGAFNKSKTLLVLIIIFLVTLIVLQAVIVALGFIYQQQVKTGITDQMTKTLAYNYSGDDGENAESLAWREMQKAFDCCGVNTTEGYKNHTNLKYEGVNGSLWYRTSDETSDWPESCCKEYKNGTEHGSIACEYDNSYLSEVGCADSVQAFLQKHMFAIALVAIFILLFEIAAMTCACKLTRAVPETPKKRKQSLINDDDLQLEHYSY